MHEALAGLVMWSHPLGSNQDLSGFSRARRPTAPEWDEVPCAGEQTPGTARSFSMGACQGTLIIIALQLSETSRGARGAHLGQ